MQVGGLSTNAFLSLAAGNPIARLRQADADIRTEALRRAAASGADVSVTKLHYTVGPDGQMYATQAAISTSTRTKGADRFQQPGIGGQSTAPGNDNAYDAPSRKQSFGDLLPPQLAISPFDLARLQEDNQNYVRTRLMMADTGTRSHEHQHFFSAGGLVEGLPEYEYQEGPDGELYAVGGHVDVSTTPTGDPEKAARDAASLSLAAQAPGDASAADVSAARTSLGKGAASYAQANMLGFGTIFDLAA